MKSVWDRTHEMLNKVMRVKGTVKAQGSICFWCRRADSNGWWALSRGSV